MHRVSMLLVATALLFGGRAKAGPIYDNLPFETYRPQDGVTISGAASPAHVTLSDTETFVATASGFVGDIKLAMWHTLLGTSDFTLTLSDAKNNVLESWSTTAPSGLPTSVVEVDSVLHPLLTAGKSYNLTAVAGDKTWDAWEKLTDTFNGNPGFQVDAAPTPEPGSLALLGVAGIGMLGAKLRKRMAKKAAV